jgi:hypothetical protein
MGRAVVDIKEWVANGRFEGEQKLQNREGMLTISYRVRVRVVVRNAHRDRVMIVRWERGQLQSRKVL